MRLFDFSMMIAKPMIKKIALPGNVMIPRQILLPFAHRRPHARLARKCNNRVQMIGHQQHQPAVPLKALVIINSGGENNVTDAYSTKMIVMLSFAMNRDEKETAF